MRTFDEDVVVKLKEVWVRGRLESEICEGKACLTRNLLHLNVWIRNFFNTSTQDFDLLRMFYSVSTTLLLKTRTVMPIYFEVEHLLRAYVVSGMPHKSVRMIAQDLLHYILGKTNSVSDLMFKLRVKIINLHHQYRCGGSATKTGLCSMHNTFFRVEPEEEG